MKYAHNVLSNYICRWTKHKYFLTLLLALSCSVANASQLNIVIVLDGSGSMNDTFRANKKITKMTAAKNALNYVIDLLPPDTKIGIVVFSGRFDGWLYPLNDLDKTKIKELIATVEAGGGTPLGRYMKIGANSLIELRNKQKYGIYKLMIVTDGESSDDADTPLTGKYGILSKGLLVEAIGVDMSSSHTLATKVAYRSANSPQELQKAMKAVAEVNNNDNTSNEDYQLIAPLAPQLAMAAVTALCEYDNSPVGVAPKVQEKSISADNSSVDSSGIGIFGTIVIVVLGILFVVLLIVAILTKGFSDV